MKSSVIVFPGSNCDRDIAVALEKMHFKNPVGSFEELFNEMEENINILKNQILYNKENEI